MTQFCFCCIFACVLYLILVFEQFCFCRYSLYLFVFYCSSFCLRLTHFASLLLIACFNFLLASSSSLSWPTVTCKICIKIKIWSPVLSNSLYYVTFCVPCHEENNGADEEQVPLSIECAPTGVHYHTWPDCTWFCIIREVLNITVWNLTSPQIFCGLWSQCVEWNDLLKGSGGPYARKLVS